MRITHYTLNSAKYMLNKRQYRPLPTDKKNHLQHVHDMRSACTILYNRLHSTTPVTHIALTCRPPVTIRCTISPRALNRQPADSIKDFHDSTAIKRAYHQHLTIQCRVSLASPISRLSMGITSL